VNSSLKFVCKWTAVKVVNNETPFTGAFGKGDIFYIPIAHGEGRYIADRKMLKAIKSRNQIVLVYSEDNPNGSVGAIAGLCNKQGNVVGVMPHPERGTESILTPFGLTNAYSFFDSLRIYCSKNH
jgi:phosphoribosylformylglycinamidine synthase subunit PurQ / glutaminase